MSQGLAGYILRRLLWTVPVIVAISIMVFLLLRLAPQDPIDSLLGQRYDDEIADRLRAKYGYDRPLHIQYLKYVQNIFQGDLGVSTQHGDFSVAEWSFPKVRVSAGLNIMAMILIFGLGIPVGVYAALACGVLFSTRSSSASGCSSTRSRFSCRPSGRAVVVRTQAWLG